MLADYARLSEQMGSFLAEAEVFASESGTRRAKTSKAERKTLESLRERVGVEAMSHEITHASKQARDATAACYRSFQPETWERRRHEAPRGGGGRDVDVEDIGEEMERATGGGSGSSRGRGTRSGRLLEL